MAHLAWNTLLADGVLCDMHIVSEDGDKIPAHKIVLGAQSRTIREAIEKRQPSEEDFVFHVDFSSQVIRHVAKVLYTGKFEPLDEPCTCVKQEKPAGSANGNKLGGEGPDNANHPHRMLFCAQAIHLLQYMQIFSPELGKQGWATLRSISGPNNNHADFLLVVEYTLQHNYPEGFSNTSVPWFVLHYKNHPNIRKVLKPILLKHPEALETLCRYLAAALEGNEVKLVAANREVNRLTVNASQPPPWRRALDIPATSPFPNKGTPSPAGPQPSSKRPRNG